MSVSGGLLHSTALFVPPFDQALSPAAVDLRCTINEVLLTGVSVNVSSRIDEMTDKLLSAISNTHNEGVYVNPEAVDRALAVIWSLPPHLPTPKIEVESDGEIGLDWDEGRRQVLSVSVGEGSMLSYAALIGAEPVHGRVPFAGTLPETLGFLLDRLYSVHAITNHA